MKSHTIIVNIEASGHKIPPFIGSRASRLLREQFSFSQIGCAAFQVINENVAVFEIYAPNAIDANDIITAVNRAISEYMPNLPSMSYKTGLLSTIDCINQDI